MIISRKGQRDCIQPSLRLPNSFLVSDKFYSPFCKFARSRFTQNGNEQTAEATGCCSFAKRCGQMGALSRSVRELSIKSGKGTGKDNSHATSNCSEWNLLVMRQQRGFFGDLDFPAHHVSTVGRNEAGRYWFAYHYCS